MCRNGAEVNGDALLRLALDEDLGERGDVTARATVPADHSASGRFVLREPGTVAGIGVAGRVFALIDSGLSFRAAARDGDALPDGGLVATVQGSARSILAGERTALNLLTHLGGVATVTARYVRAVEGTGAAIRDTRKTMPGMRALEKAAVAAAGGSNHRFGLFDGLLVKDNHVVAAGGVGPATAAALAGAGGLSVQVEVDSLAELDEALAAGAPSVLLDNFSVRDTHAAVARCRAQRELVFIEASGGITLDTVSEIAAAGVDAVAVGALTHSAPALDVALDFDQWTREA